jgi:hypothetical protein
MAIHFPLHPVIFPRRLYPQLVADNNTPPIGLCRACEHQSHNFHNFLNNIRSLHSCGVVWTTCVPHPVLKYHFMLAFKNDEIATS